MNSLPRSRNFRAAFTLIELLTVITIIAILMGLLFPAIAIVKEQARKAQAKADVAGIAAAVKQYYTEYGKYPIGSQPSGQDTLFGDKVSNKELFDILRNITPAGGSAPNYNPRGIVFFEGRMASSPDAPRAGFVPSDAKTGTPGAFVDPWGQEYRIAIDSDYDNQLTNLPYTDFTTNVPRTGVGVFSLGKDGKLGNNGDNAYRNGSTNSDDIITWQ
jgi:prepilin-type N-terminal cleavage/methylation domain-containing protein